MRKERSDKKREIKPLISVEAKDLIYRMSNITFTPVKDISEYLVAFALKDRQTFETLNKHFRRGFLINTTYHVGHLDAIPIKKRISGPTGKVTIKFKKDDYELISTLAYALDCTPTRVTAILLDMSTRNIRAVNKYIREYLIDELSESQMRDLRKILSYVNRYSGDNSSWLTILSAIVGNIRPATRKLRELVEEFIKGKV